MLNEKWLNNIHSDQDLTFFCFTMWNSIILYQRKGDCASNNMFYYYYYHGTEKNNI